MGPARRRSRGSSGPRADDVEPAPEPGARVHRDVDALVRRQRGHAQVRVADRAGLDRPEERRPHRGVDDARLPPPDPPDAGGHVPRDAPEVAGAPAGRAVPPAERGEGDPERPARERRHPPDVGALERPRVAHRREAVDHVRRAGGRPGPDRDAVARRQDEIVAPEVEAAHREREQGQVLAESARRAGQPLDEGRPDGPRLDGRRDAAGDVDEREDVRRGKEADQGLEDALPSPHAGQPVMDQRDPHQSPTFLRPPAPHGRRRPWPRRRAATKMRARGPVHGPGARRGEVLDRPEYT